MPKPPGARAVNTSSQVGESNNRGEKPRHVAATMAPTVPGSRYRGFCNQLQKTRGWTGSLWVHEIKRDGYPVHLSREGRSVRIFIRRGKEWTERMPGIIAGMVRGLGCCAAFQG